MVGGPRQRVCSRANNQIDAKRGNSVFVLRSQIAAPGKPTRATSLFAEWPFDL